MRRAAAPLLALLALCGCGGVEPAGAPGPTPTVTQQAPASARTVVRAAAPAALRLGDVSVRLRSLRFRRHVASAAAPPGTAVYAEATLIVTNLSRRPQRLEPTQLWLLDASGRPSLPLAVRGTRDALVGWQLAPGASRTGTVVFALPDRHARGLVVYRFADAAAIAHARTVGVLALPARFG